ncbi:hypothetical protein QYE76_026438 [Lolium multiflorum]|uniref:CCHC-type domain-containing protein n=1 Tax=Lolium multiflorum TaxID=4521 RepID=A0AAD8RHR4_LOLMU|nr:hypothetical protein QYE76_026438 [Lolium multiflorum]
MKKERKARGKNPLTSPARGRRGGKKVAARPVRPAREVGAYADYEGLCLLCTQPGHRAVDCTTGPVCLRCGETGHMARECSLPRPPRPSTPPDGEEPARKRMSGEGRYHRVGESPNDLRARAPEGRQAAVEPRGRHREVAPDPRAASSERRVTAPRRGAPAPPRARQGAAFARRVVPAAVVARTVAPVPTLVARELPAGDDRVVAPVLPAVRRGTDAARPRRSADEQVAPLGLRRPAFGGELARRPARASCVLPRTPEMDEAEEALAKALLAVIVGVRRTVTAEEVAMALEDVHGLAPGSFSVHCHRPEDFLLYFASQVDRDRVLGDGVLASPYFRLLLRPWSRRTHAASGGLCVHTELEIEGVPANAWSLATAEAVLAPTAWVERLHPLTRTRADMGVLRLTAWCLDPAAIPREVDLHVVEPDDPPSLADMAAPSQAVVPPHINTLVYPLLVHVTKTVDFRRSTPSNAAAGGADDGRASAWPAVRQFQYTRGVPDVLPSSGGGGGAAPSAGHGGGGGGSRTLTSGVVVGAPDQDAPRQAAKRKKGRGGRKVRALRAKAALAAQSAAMEDRRDDVGGAADSALTLDADRGEPLEEQDPVQSDALTAVMEEDRAGRVGEAGRELEGAVHLGTELRVGSVVVIPAASASQKELTSVQSPAAPVPGSVLEKTTGVPASPMLGSPSLGPGQAEGPLLLTRPACQLGQAQVGSVVVAEGGLGQAQERDRLAATDAREPPSLGGSTLTLDDHHDADATSPVLQLVTAVTAAASMEAHHPGEDNADDDRVDEEIVVDSPPARVTRDVAPPGASPTSRSDALLQTPAVRRRLVELNFQPRRSSRIAGQPGGLSAEMKAVRNLMRKLGLLQGDEAPSEAALEAYHKMYELPLTDDMIEAIAEFYGWSLSTIRGCSPPLLGMSGGRLIEA